MRPSQYNYLKRSFTRTMSNRGEEIISKIILFPFRLMILVFLVMLYAGFLILYYGTQILFKIIFKLLKFIFSFLKSAFKGFIVFSKQYISKEKQLLEKYKKDKKYIDYINKNDGINIPDMMKEFNISSHKAINIISELQKNNPD